MTSLNVFTLLPFESHVLNWCLGLCEVWSYSHGFQFRLPFIIDFTNLFISELYNGFVNLSFNVLLLSYLTRSLSLYTIQLISITSHFLNFVLNKIIILYI